MKALFFLLLTVASAKTNDVAAAIKEEMAEINTAIAVGSISSERFSGIAHAFIASVKNIRRVFSGAKTDRMREQLKHLDEARNSNLLRRYDETKAAFIMQQRALYPDNPLLPAMGTEHSGSDLKKILANEDSPLSPSQILLAFEFAATLPDESALWQLLQALNPDDPRHASLRVPGFNEHDKRELIRLVGRPYMPSSYLRLLWQRTVLKPSKSSEKVLRDLLENASLSAKKAPHIFIDLLGTINELVPSLVERVATGKHDMELSEICRCYAKFLLFLQNNKGTRELLKKELKRFPIAAGLWLQVYGQLILTSRLTLQPIDKRARFLWDAIIKMDPELNLTMELKQPFLQAQIVDLALLLKQHSLLTEASRSRTWKDKLLLYGQLRARGILKPIRPSYFSFRVALTTQLDRLLEEKTRLKSPCTVRSKQRSIFLPSIDAAYFSMEENLAMAYSLLLAIFPARPIAAFHTDRPLAHLPLAVHLNRRVKEICRTGKQRPAVLFLQEEEAESDYDIPVL